MKCGNNFAPHYFLISKNLEFMKNYNKKYEKARSSQEKEPNKNLAEINRAKNSFSLWKNS